MALKSGEAGLPFEGARRGRLFGQEAQYTKRLVAMIDDPSSAPPEILKLDMLQLSEMLSRQNWAK